MRVHKCNHITVAVVDKVASEDWTVAAERPASFVAVPASMINTKMFVICACAGQKRLRYLFVSQHLVQSVTSQ